MGDNAPVDPKDSFANRLAGALGGAKNDGIGSAADKAGKDAASPPPSTSGVQPTSATPTGTPDPKDSFSNRLAGALGANKGGDDFAKDSHAGNTASAAKHTDEVVPTPHAAHGEDVPPDRPIGAGEVVAREGDCIVSLAHTAGHFWKTVWDDPANATLRSIRKDPCILLAGDRVHIPPLRQKQEPGSTEKRHRFRRKGEPEIFQVQILRDDEPRGNQPYTLSIDGFTEIFQGYTDAQGMIRHIISPKAMQAVLSVGVADDMQTYFLRLGGLDPIDTTRGVQQRLNNLGFSCGDVDGKIGPLTRAALRKFQRSKKLPASGAPDEATRKELQDSYGC